MLDNLKYNPVDSTASAQWATRPDDQRFTSLESLIASLDARTATRAESLVDLRAMSARASDRGIVIDCEMDTITGQWSPSHHAFGQLAQAAGAPAGYLRTLPSDLAARCLTSGLRSAGDSVKLYHGQTDLAAVTGPNYGRVRDLDVAREIQRVTDESGVRWTVPTAFRSASNMHDSHYASVDPTIESTTLYASDHDVFVFLVDEEHPIQAGFTRDGKPDLFFRGFYAWNGECGDVTGGFKAFLYRYVCVNRNIWGQAELGQFRFKHTKNAGLRVADSLIPMLTGYANGSAAGIESGLLRLKREVIARTDEERNAFLFRLGFGRSDASAVLARGQLEDGEPAETVFDFVQAITAAARSIGHTDTRVAMETVAGKLMDKALALA